MNYFTLIFVSAPGFFVVSSLAANDLLDPARLPLLPLPPEEDVSRLKTLLPLPPPLDLRLLSEEWRRLSVPGREDDSLEKTERIFCYLMGELQPF